MGAELRAKNRETSDPNQKIDKAEANLSTSSLQFPLDLTTNAESFYIEFSAFKYTRKKQSNATTRRPGGTRIRLPIGGNIQQGYSMQYNDFEGSYLYELAYNAIKGGASQAAQNISSSGSLLDKLTGGVGGFAEGFGDNFDTGSLSAYTGVLGRNIASFGGIFKNQAAAIEGNIVNPRQETAFGGVNLRQHAFEYTLIPKNEKEANNIDTIIKEFKLQQHPNSSASAVFLNFPSEWEIRFYASNSTEPIKIPPIPDCFLVDFTVVYNPQGTARFYQNNSPSAVRISLSFKEANILTREDIEAGF